MVSGSCVERSENRILGEPGTQRWRWVIIAVQVFFGSAELATLCGLDGGILGVSTGYQEVLESDPIRVGGAPPTPGMGFLRITHRAWRRAARSLSGRLSEPVPKRRMPGQLLDPGDG